MYRPLALGISFLLSASLSSALAEEPDSLSLSRPPVGGDISIDAPRSQLLRDAQMVGRMQTHDAPFGLSPLSTRLADIKAGFTPGLIANWQGGYLYGDASQLTFPGMGAIENGSIGITQQFGRFSVNAFGSALHYGYFGGMSTAVGFGGSMSYQISDRVGVTVFGQYFTRPNGLPYGMMAYSSTTNFGGYVNYRFADRWGVKAGAQTFRNNADGRYHTQPMLIPYYRISEKAEIGIDVGGILYNVLRSNSNHDFGGRRNPTLGPPDVIRAGAYPY